MSDLPVHALTPAPITPSSGHLVDASCNPALALGLMVEYLNSTYKLQAKDTALEVAITNAETKKVQEFEDGLTQKGGDYKHGTNYIYLLEHLEEIMTKDNKGKKPSSTDLNNAESRITQLLGAAQSKNQAAVKIMDGNNSTAQNTLSQNAQGQQGIIQAMSAINGIGGNLARILQG